MIPWAPTWLPAGIGETGRLAGFSTQQRFYGRAAHGPLVLVTLAEPVVSSPPSATDCGGTPPEADGAPVAAVIVAGRPARVWPTRRAPVLSALLPGARPVAASGHLVCVPLAGGGSLSVVVTGTADTAGDVVRVAGSVRVAEPAEVAVPFSVGAPVSGVQVRADDTAPGRWIGGVAEQGTVIEVGRPDPGGPAPNTTVGGRPAHVKSSPTTGTFVTVPLGSDLEARLVGEFRDPTLAAVAALKIGPSPDYSWFNR